MSENIIKRASSAKHYSVVFAISLLILTSLIFRIYAVSPALAGPVLPTGGSFAFGSGTISSSGPSMTVNQAASKGIINWQGFSIGKGGSVLFNNGQGATLNRVTGSSLSSIAGLLKATGSLYLINPNGIVITSTGSVITGGDFIASTLNISDSDFLNGNLSFYGSTGSVTNNGSIVSSGNAVLVGTVAVNTGTITAPNGTASMVSGTRLVLIPENGPSGILISPSSLPGNVTNSGIIKAASVYLSSSNGDVYALAGNNGGLIEATGTKTINGQIWLTAPKGAVSVNSSVTASGSDGSILIDGLNNYINSNSILNASGSGGVIKIGLFPSLPESLSTTLSSGATLLAGGINGKGFIDTSGDTLSIGNITVNANGGEWLLDPEDLTIDSTAATTIDNTLGSSGTGTNVTLETTSAGTSSTVGTTTTSPSAIGTSGSSTDPGNINVDAPISWGSTASLTLSAYNSINVNSTITASGGGGLVLDYNTGGATSDYSTDTDVLKIAMGMGSVQFTGTSSGNPTGTITTKDYNNTAVTYTLVNANNLSSVSGTGDYALAADITLPSTSFTPIGESTPFTGIFNGLGNTITGLKIGTLSLPASFQYAGLFGQIGLSGTVENIGVTNEDIYNEYSQDSVGGLVGNNAGNITDSYSAGLIMNTTGSGSSGNDSVGGIAGYNTGTIEYSYSTGSVTNTDYLGYDRVGGLAGFNANIIEYSYSTGLVTNTSGSGSGGLDSVGGLVGLNASGTTISDSYSTGSVTNTDNSSSGYDNVGGLVGNNSGGTITDSYSTGSVTNTDGSGSVDSVGGLVGYNPGGTITDSYSTGSVMNTSGSGSTGGDSVGGLVGYTSNGTIEYSYSTGSVTNTDHSSGGHDNVGGLVGYTSNGTIEYSYSTGSVTNTSGSGADLVGGLAGYNSGGAITDSYWDTTNATGTTLEIGNDTSSTDVNGLTDTQMKQSSNFTGWAIDPSYTGGTTADTWYQSNGYSYPLLVSTNTAGTPMSVDGTSYTLVNASNIGDIGILSSYPLNDNYALMYDITAPSSFTPIGETTAFTGIFNGLGNTVNNLTIGSPTTSANLPYAGLFGQVGSGGSIENIGVTNEAIYNEYSSSNDYVGGLVGANGGTISDSYFTGSVTNTDNSSSGNDSVGGIAGANVGTISDSYSTGSVKNTDGSGSGGGDSVGGLAGVNSSGTISDSYSTGSVTNTDNSSGGGDNVGGLAGYNAYGTIEYSYSTGSVTNTDNSSGNDSVGGFAGDNLNGTITDSYSTGSVKNTDNSTGGNDSVGGLVGYNSGGTIEYSYSTGAVTNTHNSSGGNDSVGGLVGYNSSGTITDSYWDTTNATGTTLEIGNDTSSIDVNGLTDVQMMKSSSFTTWTGANAIDPSYTGGTTADTWYQSNGYSYPLLVSTNTAGTPMSVGGITYTLINASNINDIGILSSYPLNGDYALMYDITAPSSFTPIGETTAFTGIFNGLGNTVNNLNIGSSSSYANLQYAGLFGQIGSSGSIENIGVTNEAIYNEYSSSNDSVGGIAGYNGGTISNSYSAGSVTNTDNSSGGGDSVGGLAGVNSGGTISDSYSTGSVMNTSGSGSGGSDSVGGLAGSNSGGTITDSYSTGSVTNTDNSSRGYDHVGGLAGYNSGGISDSYSTGSVTNTSGSGSGGDHVGGLVGFGYNSSGTISDSYSTGSVTNTDDSSVGYDKIGGLVGYNSCGTISDSYSTGSVTNTDNSTSGHDSVGGLAGYNAYGTIEYSYSTGSVTNTDHSSSSDYVGGLVGYNSSGTIADSYWDTTNIAGTTLEIGNNTSSTDVNGLTDVQMMKSSNFTGFNITADPSSASSYTWFQYDGETYPLLRSFMTPLTVSANNASATYNGTAYTAAPAGVTYSPASPDTSNISGTLSYLNSSGSAPVNTGTYGLGGLYSNQQGYIISYVNGALTINPYINNTIYHKPVYSSVFQALQANTPGGISGFSGNSFNELDAMLTGYEGSGLIPNIPSPWTGWRIILKGFNRNNILGIPYGPTHKKRHNR